MPRVWKPRDSRMVVPIASGETQWLDMFAEACLTEGYGFNQAVTIVKNRLVRAALRRTGGNQCAAARLLLLHRNQVAMLIASGGRDGRSARKKLPMGASGLPSRATKRAG